VQSRQIEVKDVSISKQLSHRVNILHKFRTITRPDLIALSALFAITSAICIIRFWLRPGLGDWDIMTFYLPWYSFLGEQLRQGNIPGWNPHIFSGMPFAGDPQSGWWYFPAMVLFSIFPPIFAYKLFIWSHLLACGIGVYILARLLKLRPLGAFAGGLMFICLNLGASFTFTIQMQMAPWLPLSLIGVELAIRQTRRSAQLRALLITSFAMSQILSASIGQGTYYSALMIASYITIRFIFLGKSKNGWTWMRGITTTFIAGTWTFALAFLLGAAGLLPRLDATRRAFVMSDQYPGRHPSSDVGADPLYLAYRLLELFPAKFDLYAGGSAITIALVALVLLPKFRNFAFFGVLAWVTLILSLKPTYLHEVFYLLPEFRELHGHEPARVLSLFPFALAMLGALVVDQLQLFRKANWCIGGLAIASISWWRIIESGDKSGYYIIERTTAIGAILIGLSIAAVFALNRIRINDGLRNRLQAGVAGIILLALFLDPVGNMLSRSVGGRNEEVLTAAVSASGSKSDAGGAGEFLQQLQEESGPFRYFGYASPPEANSQLHEVFADPWVLPLLGNNRSMMLGLHDIQGYNPAQVVSYMNTFTAMNELQREYHEALVYAPALGSPILDLLNVRYVIAPKNSAPFGGEPLAADQYPAQYRPVFEDDDVIVFENLNALPHAWIVHDTVRLDSLTALEQINSGAIDPGLTATIEDTPPTMPTSADASSDSVSITHYSPDQITIQATASSDGMLVLSDVYDPDWTVTVDGKEAKMLEVDGVLRGVQIPRGEHTVDFSYNPQSLKYGFWISIVTMIGTVVALVVLRRSPRKPRTSRG
jgi:hypothetical protein